MPSWWNVPNLFTLLRLVLVPFVIQAILEGQHVLALGLFALAAVTDALDGATARHFGITTPVGTYLDPIADKCLLSGVFLALAVTGIMPRWLVAIVFGRDLYILLGVGLLLLVTGKRNFAPSIAGKASTFVQILTVVVWLSRNAFRIPALDAIASATVWLCAAFTVYSGLDYTRRGIQFVKRPLRAIDGSPPPE